MRIGNWLGGFGDLGVGRHDEYGGQVQAPPSTSRPSRWEVPWTGSPAIITYGVYVPTRFGGELTIKTTDGQGRRSEGTRRHAHGPTARTSASTSRGGTPSRSRAPRSPTRWRRRFVQVGQSTKKPWNFYYWPTKADSIHEPWAGGNGRVDTMTVNGDDQLIASPGAYIPPGRGHRPGRAQRDARDAAGRRRRRDLVPQPL